MCGAGSNMQKDCARPREPRAFITVSGGVVPRAHVFTACQGVGGRAKPGHDDFNLIEKRSNTRVSNRAGSSARNCSLRTWTSRRSRRHENDGHLHDGRRDRHVHHVRRHRHVHHDLLWPIRRWVKGLWRRQSRQRRPLQQRFCAASFPPGMRPVPLRKVHLI